MTVIPVTCSDLSLFRIQKKLGNSRIEVRAQTSFTLPSVSSLHPIQTRVNYQEFSADTRLVCNTLSY